MALFSVKALSLAAAVCALSAAILTPATAEERRQCLSRAEQRTAIKDGVAISLASVRRAVSARVGGELVRARLCHESERLIYLLTVLARDGKVRRVTVDATNGTVISGL